MDIMKVQAQIINMQVVDIQLQAGRYKVAGWYFKHAALNCNDTDEFFVSAGDPV